MESHFAELLRETIRTSESKLDIAFESEDFKDIYPRFVAFP